MNTLLNLLKTYDLFIILGLSALALVLLIWIIINSVSISRLSRKYRKFMRGSKDRNLEELLNEIMNRVDSSEEKAQRIKDLYESMDKRLDKCTQKVSMMRYKAFDNMGSALSFSIAMLDAEDSGVIITGIYGRNECITYAKPIEKGVPKYDLSGEEEQVLKDSMNKKII